MDMFSEVRSHPWLASSVTHRAILTACSPPDVLPRFQSGSQRKSNDGNTSARFPSFFADICNQTDLVSIHPHFKAKCCTQSVSPTRPNSSPTVRPSAQASPHDVRASELSPIAGISVHHWVNIAASNPSPIHNLPSILLRITWIGLSTPWAIVSFCFQVCFLRLS